MANSLQKGSGGPVRLSVGSLHLSIAENILQIDNIILMKDSGTGHSKGYGFITELDLSSASGRLHLMANLSEGSGIQLPTTAAAAAAQAAALQLNEAVPLGALNPVALTALSLALNLAPQAVTSQCFQLSSLFTPQTMVNQWHRTLLPCASRSCPSLFLICPPTAPSLHFVDQAILRAWTLIDSGGNRSHLRHQEELLPMAPLGMDPAEQRN